MFKRNLLLRTLSASFAAHDLIYLGTYRLLITQPSPRRQEIANLEVLEFEVR